jgi:hypothetical protein
MCTIIFIANIALQFQIKQELHGGLVPLDPEPDLDEKRPYVILLARPLPIPNLVNRGR